MQNSLPGNPLVSVLMPVYNGIDTIKYAIKSLQLQTYSNWELIVVNDGSTDGTGEYLNQLKLADNRFKITHLDKNRGRGFARNVCLDNAGGEYIAFLDADDIYLPNKIEKQLQFLIENPEISLVGCGVGILENGHEINYVRGKLTDIFTHGNHHNLNFVAPSVMFRSSDLNGLKYNPRLDVMEDVDFFNRLLLNKKYTNIQDNIYLYAEIGLISKSKFLKYALHTVKYYLFFIKSNFILFFSFIKSVSNLIIKCVVIQFLGVDFFLKKRSRRIDTESKMFLENYLLYIRKNN